MPKEFGKYHFDPRRENIVEEAETLRYLQQSRRELGLNDYTVTLDAKIEATQNRLAAMKAAVNHKGRQ